MFNSWLEAKMPLMGNSVGILPVGVLGLEVGIFKSTSTSTLVFTNVRVKQMMKINGKDGIFTFSHRCIRNCIFWFEQGKLHWKCPQKASIFLLSKSILCKLLNFAIEYYLCHQKRLRGFIPKWIDEVEWFIQKLIFFIFRFIRPLWPSEVKDEGDCTSWLIAGLKVFVLEPCSFLFELC